MWDYIVLGQVPGTKIQVSFEIWLISIAGIVLLGLVLLASRASHSYHPVTALRISRILKSASYGKWLVAQRFIRV